MENQPPASNDTGGDPSVEKVQSNIRFQVKFMITGLVGFLILIMLVLVSKMFRTWLALRRLSKYKSNELNQRNIVDLLTDEDLELKKLRDYYVASAFRPYVCYYHKYDYVSVEVFKEILAAGPRMVELEIFNSSYGDKVEPVVSVGEEKGEWRYTLNSVNLKEFLRAIARVAFNPTSCRVYQDPFILYLNLKTNRNVKCLNKIHKYIYDEIGQFLLGPEYSFNDKNNQFTNINLKSCLGKVIILANTGFEGSNLEELVNYSTVSNYTLKYKRNQRRILYLHHDDIVETEEDIEDFVNSEHHKVSLNQVKQYNKCGLSILSPGRGGDSLFNGISPVNNEAGRGLDAGCQFIMMNYQKLDTNMSNYMYVFKDSSLIEKAETETTSKCVNKVYQGIKEERVDLNESEINFLYASH